MQTFLRKFYADDRGTTAIEYALIGSLLSLAIVAALSSVGPAIEANFATAADAFDQ